MKVYTVIRKLKTKTKTNEKDSLKTVDSEKNKWKTVLAHIRLKVQ